MAPLLAVMIATTLQIATPDFKTTEPQLAPADTPVTRRPRAVEHSDLYYLRLTIHKDASYAIIPLFVTEYAIGRSLFAHPPGSDAARTAHSVVGAGLIGTFGLNTVTGTWNLWDSRHESSGRARRYIHTALMLLADAGFVATEATAPGDDDVITDPSRKRLHRTLAISSMGLALAGYGMMLVWK